MKTKVVLFIVFQLLFINILGAQSLKESLGGVKTNFQIYSDTVDLKASDQIIISRAEVRTYSEGVSVAYQSYHLEFITKKDLIVDLLKYRTSIDKVSKLELSFYDLKNRRLTTIEIPSEYVNVFSNITNQDNQNFYSIDLIDLPIMLLDKTTKINMIRLEAKGYR